MTIVFGSDDALIVCQRAAEIERLERMPLHRYQVIGMATLCFSTIVEARSAKEARSEVEDGSLYNLCDPADFEISIYNLDDVGLAKPDDADEQEKERAWRDRSGETLPAERLI